MPNRGAGWGLREEEDGPAFDVFLPSVFVLAETSSFHLCRNDSNSGFDSSMIRTVVQFSAESIA